MAILSKGTDFTTGDQVTAANLDALVDSATFASGAVDNTTTILDSNSPQRIIVKNEGIGTTQLADDAVTAAKIAAGALTDVVYPVGSIFTTVTNYADSAAVVTAIGGTTWTAFGAGRVLVGQDAGDTDFDTAEETGGAKTVSLSEAELPQHHHLAAVNGSVSETGDVTSSNAISEEATQGGSTNQSYTLRPATSSTFGTVGRTSQVGSGTAHNNLQPYIVVYMWKRTA
jgi:microcystin-dependent protein